MALMPSIFSNPFIWLINFPVFIIFNSTPFLLAFLYTFSSMGNAPPKPVPINNVLHLQGISSLSVRGVCPPFSLNSFEAFFFLFSIYPLFITISLEYSLPSTTIFPNSPDIFINHLMFFSYFYYIKFLINKAIVGGFLYGINSIRFVLTCPR